MSAVSWPSPPEESQGGEGEETAARQTNLLILIVDMSMMKKLLER